MTTRTEARIKPVESPRPGAHGAQPAVSMHTVSSSLDWDLVASDWRSVSRQAGFYLGYSWLKSWWECYGSDDLFIHVGRSGDEPVALAPMTYSQRRWNGIPVNVVGNLFNAHLCRSEVAIADPELEPELARALIGAVNERPWDVMFFREMPVRSPFLFQLNELCRETGLRIYLRSSLDSPYVVVDRDWPDFLATTSKSFRKKLRNKKNRLRARGMSVDFDCLRRAMDIEAVLPEVMAVARVSWSGERGSSIASGRNRLFYEPAFLRLAAEGHLRIWTLRLDGRLAAFEIHVPWGRVDNAVKACFDPRFGELSPGALLDAHVMESLFTEREFDRYDLLGSTDAYKLHWTEDIERHVEVFVFNERVRSRALELLEFGVRPRMGAAKRGLQGLRSRLMGPATARGKREEHQ